MVTIPYRSDVHAGRVIELKSGASVVMTEGYFKKFAEAYSMSVSKLANLKALDD